MFRLYRDARAYRDAIFQVVTILDLPMEQWEARYRGRMSEEEWFGFQRGYQQALIDVLRMLGYQMQIHVHQSRLQPTPDTEESLSDYAPR